MGDERFGSNYWHNISVHRHAKNVGVEGGDEPAREAVVGDQGRSVATKAGLDCPKCGGSVMSRPVVVHGSGSELGPGSVKELMVCVQCGHEPFQARRHPEMELPARPPVAGARTITMKDISQ